MPKDTCGRPAGDAPGRPPPIIAMPRPRRTPRPTPDVGRDGASSAPADAPWSIDAAPADPAFLTADDFDATGILAGVDTCASSYWWVAELQSASADTVAPLADVGGTPQAVPPSRHQAARRSASRSSTAAA